MFEKQHKRRPPAQVAARPTSPAAALSDRPWRTGRNRGFTLIDVMITVVIIAVLATIAVPAYLSQVQKSRRTSAQTALLAMASREEQYYSLNNKYSSTPTDFGYTAWNVPVPDANNIYYQMTVTTPTASTFTITAVPIGSQASDSCGTYAVNNLGVQSAATTGCW